MSNDRKILLVEDDAIITSGLEYALTQEGYSVTCAKTVAEAQLAVRESDPKGAPKSTQNNAQGGGFDLAILDMQLPDGTGFDVHKLLKDTDTAIIFLTVIDDEGNIVRAFESGADDYVTKPFRLRELLARVRRTLGKHSDTDTSEIKLNGVTIDTAAGKVYIDGGLLELTALEYRLLLTFAQNKGRILTRSQILESIWDAAGNFVEDNTLTVYIKRLREKLQDAVTIETVRGVGYRVN